MKISGVQAQLIGSDILSIINEFVKVDGLELKEVTIDNAINIKGTFKKGVSIDFAGQLTIEKVENSIVTAKFSKLKLMKFGFFRPIRSLALKIGLGQLKIIGIDATKDRVILDIKKLLKDIPYVDIDLKALYIKGQALHAEVENINISLMGNIIKVEEPEVITEDADEVEEPVNKVADYYTLGRDKLQEKLPDGAKKISDYIFVVPDIVALICRMLKDSRVPIKTKLVVSASLAYVIFPTDLIPDKIPFIGKIDEIAVVFFALNRIATDVPTKVILENWAGKDELVLVLKNGLEYVTNFTGAKNVEKLYNVVEELSTL
ncbi:YkvA family protein [Clostridium paraputrificum]|uniref:YkvA family protein n=1 Tax=Clostridium paraputrificum TaxID=29363 RepID=UPI003F637F95